MLSTRVCFFFFADGSFLRTLASSLIDFNELSSVAALNMLLEVGRCSALSRVASRGSSCPSKTNFGSSKQRAEAKL